jgi:hypothetical protein
MMAVMMQSRPVKMTNSGMLMETVMAVESRMMA